MNIIREDVDAKQGAVRIVVEKDDYAEAVDKSLKTYRKNQTLKGFRPGMAPIGLIRKLYLDTVKLHEITRIAAEQLTDYIRDKEVDLVVSPLLREPEQPVDWLNDEKFEFVWDLALVPAFDLAISKDDHFPVYKITIDDKVRQQYVDGFCKQWGRDKPVDVASAQSKIYFDLIELDSEHAPVTDGLTVHDALFWLQNETRDEVLQMFVGAKVGDVMVIDVTQLFSSIYAQANFLKLKQPVENIDTFQPNFQATVTKIVEQRPAEVNQDLFDTVFGKGVVSTVDEFNDRMDSFIEQDFNRLSDSRFRIDARRILSERFTAPLADDIIKRQLIRERYQNYTPDDMEDLDKQYPEILWSLRWELISTRLARKNNLLITKEEELDYAKYLLHGNNVNMFSGPRTDEELEVYAKRLLAHEDQRDAVIRYALDDKVFNWIRETVTLDMKEISRDDFNGLQTN